MTPPAPPPDDTAPEPPAAAPPVVDREITLEEWIAAGQGCCGAAGE